MNLQELKEHTDAAIEGAVECGDDPENITVSIQIECAEAAVWSDEVELHYDCDGMASGCVLEGPKNKI